MVLQQIQGVNDLLSYLREFKNWNGDDFQYDFNLCVHLFLALLDNLKQNSLEGEIEEIAYSFTDDQRKFILHLAQSANRLTDQEILNSED